MRYCHKTNSILLRIVLCDSFNTLFLGNAQDLFKFMGFSETSTLSAKLQQLFPFCLPFSVWFLPNADYMHKAMLFQIPVFSLSAKWGLDVLPPVSDGHKKTATVHSLLFSPNAAVCTTLIQVKCPSKTLNESQWKLQLPIWLMMYLWLYNDDID